MARSQINLQDAFLNHVRKEKIPVTLNLTSGGPVEGVVKGFDNFVILIKNERQHLIYKHAINTIVPSKAVELSAPPHHQANAVHHKDVSDPGPETTATKPAEDEEPWVEG